MTVVRDEYSECRMNFIGAFIYIVYFKNLPIVWGIFFICGAGI